MSLRILCDCDGVLADFVGLVLDYVQKNTGLSYRRAAIDQWDCFAVLGLPEHWPFFRTQCDDLGLCLSMREMPGALAFLAELRRLGSVKVATTPISPAWMAQRAEWLERRGVALRDQIHGDDKADLAGAWDILIDDRAENCEAFVQRGGRAWCIAAPYNTHVVSHLPSLLRRGTHEDCLAWLRGL